MQCDAAISPFAVPCEVEHQCLLVSSRPGSVLLRNAWSFPLGFYQVVLELVHLVDSFVWHLLEALRCVVQF